MKKIKILMIEENEILRFYFRDSFWLHSVRDEYELSFAKDFGEAANILSRADAVFDIIFLELAMHIPHENRTVFDPQAGLKLIEKIRSLSGLKTAKIVVFSSKEYYHLWKRAKKLGANFFFKKDEYLPRYLVHWVENIFKKN